jgi:hypothetical protein
LSSRRKPRHACAPPPAAPLFRCIGTPASCSPPRQTAISPPFRHRWNPGLAPAARFAAGCARSPRRSPAAARDKRLVAVLLATGETAWSHRADQPHHRHAGAR